jgi:aspartyl-tRNA(Asn)/glutamyl-tRNA(Gln) amidotransferase subunit C
MPGIGKLTLGEITYQFCIPAANLLSLQVIIFIMSLTLEQVEHIAALARLELTEQEKTRYREQLSAVLDYFAQLQALDTSGIPPTSSVLPARSVLRPDQARHGLDLEELLRNAPDTRDQQFRVPPVLE